MIVLLYMWQKKAQNIYRSFCGVLSSTKTFKKILVADVGVSYVIKRLNYITKNLLV